MSHTVVLRLSDEDYAPIEREAAATGRTPAEIIVARLRGDAAPSDGRQVLSAQPSQSPAPSSDIVDEAAVRAAFMVVAQEKAAQTGRDVEEVLAEIRAKYRPLPRQPLSEAERQAALAQLLKFAGAVDSGDPNSGDNERIDADLAREYGRGLDGDE
jgi:predicted component of type VI protein secretion system